MTSTFPSTPLATDNPRQAREVVAQQLTAWGLGHLADDLELIVSELITNAIRHGGGVRAVTLTARDGYARIEVADNDETMPTPRTAGPTDTGGRGLLLIEALSRAWGARPDDGGKVVWAEVVGTARPAQ